MKYRESGMPDEEMWSGFFNPQETLSLLGVNEQIDSFLDIGCGYGTFLLPAAHLVKHAIGIEIDVAMIEHCKKEIDKRKIGNVELFVGDITQEKTTKQVKLCNKKIEDVSLFNILHGEEPLQLLSSVHELLAVGGILGIIHWNNADTPRGPSLSIRPTPEQVIEWATTIHFSLVKQIDLPPYRYGVVFKKS